VATVGVDNAKNAAYMAARILALHDAKLRDALEAERKAQQERYDK
jgi:phosphoribosylcarboxyaminoimidazole (NCAIR) mutase